MANQFMRADEVAKELGISRSYAYELIRQLNQEFKERGFLTIAGRINRDYLRERLYTAESGVKQKVGLYGRKKRGMVRAGLVSRLEGRRPPEMQALL